MCYFILCGRDSAPVHSTKKTERLTPGELHPLILPQSEDHSGLIGVGIEKAVLDKKLHGVECCVSHESSKGSSKKLLPCLSSDVSARAVSRIMDITIEKLSV